MSGLFDPVVMLSGNQQSTGAERFSVRKPRPKWKTLGALFYDAAMAPVAFIGALMLRHGLIGYEKTVGFWLEASAILIPVALAAGYFSGLHWGCLALRVDTRSGEYPACFGDRCTGLLPLLFAFNRLEDVPRTVPFIIMFFLLVGLVAGPRLLLRMLAEGGVSAMAGRVRRTGDVPVLLVGAGRGPNCSCAKSTAVRPGMIRWASLMIQAVRLAALFMAARFWVALRTWRPSSSG